MPRKNCDGSYAIAVYFAIRRVPLASKAGTDCRLIKYISEVLTPVYVMWLIGLLLFFVTASRQLSISEFDVPDAVRLGDNASLQCRYELDPLESDQSLFVKWWWTPLNGSSDERTQLYQRIAGRSGSGVDLDLTTTDDGPDEDSDDDVLVTCQADAINASESVTSLGDDTYDILINMTVSELAPGSDVSCKLSFLNLNVSDALFTATETYNDS
ncbi:unnamed protein product, partial [Leptidea sinapis]